MLRAGFVLVVLCVPAIALGAPFVFDRTDLPAGNAPLWIAPADFNHDTHLDLAVSIFSGAAVSIYLGNGSGGFQRAPDVPVGTRPWGLADGDFNRDGHADLAVANAEDDNVSILLGDGTGGFAAGAVVPAGDYPHGIVVADFDEDQNLDLAVSNLLLGGNVTIHVGDGQGGFAPGPVLVGGAGPGQGGRSDFNQDGHADLAVGYENSDDVGVWFGNGDGTFAGRLSLPVVEHPHGCTVGRINGDAYDDIAAENLRAIPPVVSVFLGNGAGGFSPAMNYPSGGAAPTNVAIADLDRDGFTDFAVANRDAVPATISILAGDGAGAFGAPQLVAVSQTPQCILTADFDEDGRTDLAVTGFNANLLTVLLNRTPLPAGVEAAAPAPALVRLAPVAPNPFRGGGLIRFELEAERRVVLRMIDVAGRPVRVLLDAPLARGPHAVVWDGRDAAGGAVPSGAYFLELSGAGATVTGKLIVAP